MAVTNPPRICQIEPFLYQATPQPVGEEASTSNQINEQAIENYLNRLREALCEDIQEIVNEIVSNP